MIDFSEATAVDSHLLGTWPLHETTEYHAILIREHSCQFIEQTGRKGKETERGWGPHKSAQDTHAVLRMLR